MSLERLAHEVESLFAQLVREGGRLGQDDPSGLTATQKVALTAIADVGPLRLRAVAENLTTTHATATRTVDALERGGYVRRLEVSGDRRGVLVAATDKGGLYVAERRRRRLELLRHLLSDVPEGELGRLAGLLEQLNAQLGADAAPGGDWRGVRAGRCASPG